MAGLEPGEDPDDIVDGLGAIKIVDLAGRKVGQHLGADDSGEAEDLSVSGITTAYLGEMGDPKDPAAAKAVEEGLEGFEAWFVDLLEE